MWLETMTWRPSSPHCLKQRDGFGAGHGIEAVERLVEHQHGRAVGDGLRQFDALPHAFAVSGDGAVGGFGHGNTLEGFLGQLGGFGLDHAVHQQERIDELVAGEAFRERHRIGCSSPFCGTALRGVLGGMPSTLMAPREGRIRPVIRFMSVVLPEPLGPTRLVMPGGMERFTRLTPSTSP